VSERELLQGLSHELRAPLQALLGHIDLLRDGTYGPLNPEQRRALDSIAAGADRILAIARDVLQVARIDAGHERVIVGEVDLAGLVRAEAEAIRPLATAAGLQLAVECPPDLTVTSDGRKIARILANLLGNAVKYTTSGSITVRAGREEGAVFLEVRDTGVGIPPELHEAVFLEYVRAPGTAQEGTGLGLPIARRLATLLGGSLQLESAPGRGTTLRLLLPSGA